MVSRGYPKESQGCPMDNPKWNQGISMDIQRVSKGVQGYPKRVSNMGIQAMFKSWA